LYWRSSHATHAALAWHGELEARRSASLPASLAVQPAHPVRSFELAALTRLAFRLSLEARSNGDVIVAKRSLGRPEG